MAESRGYLPRLNPSFRFLIGASPTAEVSPAIDPDAVDAPTEEYLEDAAIREICRDLYEGEAALKAKASTYLPQETAEEDDDWYRRVDRAYLFNGFRRAIKTLSGKPFTRPIKRTSESKPFLEFLDDVDLQGTKLEVFCRSLFENAMIDGVAFIHVELPRSDGNSPTSYATLSEIEQKRIRPYWVMYRAADVIGWRYAQSQSGVISLAQVRLCENRIEPDGAFGSRVAQRIRVLSPGAYEVHLYDENDKVWRVEEFGVTSLSFIPIVPVRIGTMDPMRGRPPLFDLANLNLAHFRSVADQRHILHVARVPFLFGSGIKDDDESFAVSPNTAIIQDDPQANLRYVEHSGQAIASGQIDLDTLQMMMSEAALEMLIPKAGNVTATASAINAAESVSEMQANAVELTDATNRALAITAELIPRGPSDKVEGGTIEIYSDFAFSYRDIEEMRLLFQTRTNRDLSKRYYLAALDRRGILGPDFDHAKNDKELEEEAAREAEELAKSVAMIPAQNAPSVKSKQRETSDSTEATKQRGEQVAG